MKMTFLAVLLAASALLPLTGHADQISDRLARQHQRLQAGRATGTVGSNTGAGTFKGGYTRIQNEVTTMKAANGGSLSAADTAKVNQQLNARSQRIYAAKHKPQVGGWPTGR